MTILVGIKCTDGIIIGSDSSATLSAGQISTIEQSTKKIQILHESIIVAGTGSVGLGQRFCDVIDNAYASKKFVGMNGIQVATTITSLAIENFMSTRVSPGQYGALVAFPANGDIHLCEFGNADMQPELKTTGIWYASMGSGQLIADPFLGLMRNVFWGEGMPTLQEGIFIATWTIDNAIKLNTGGVNGPVQLSILTKNGQAKLLDESELVEHKENVEGVMAHLRAYREKFSGKSAPALPKAPS